MGTACSCCRSRRRELQLKFGAMTQTGARAVNEDVFSVVAALPLPGRWRAAYGAGGLRVRPSLFAVYDGHRGPSAARFARGYMPSVVARALAAMPSRVRQALAGARPVDDDDAVVLGEAMRDAFVATDGAWLAHARRQSPPLSDGCTASVALVAPGAIVAAAVGDSQILLVTVDEAEAGASGSSSDWGSYDDDVLSVSSWISMSSGNRPMQPLPGYGTRSWRAELVTPQHKARDVGERKRVLAAGATINGPYIGAESTSRAIAVSRAFGDIELKIPRGAPPEELIISPIPAVYTRPLDGTEAMLIVASDGVWDKLSPAKAAYLAAASLLRDPSLSQAAAEVTSAAIAAGSSDNVTAVVVVFGKQNHE